MSNKKPCPDLEQLFCNEKSDLVSTAVYEPSPRGCFCVAGVCYCEASCLDCFYCRTSADGYFCADTGDKVSVFEICDDFELRLAPMKV